MQIYDPYYCFLHIDNLKQDKPLGKMLEPLDGWVEYRCNESSLIIIWVKKHADRMLEKVSTLVNNCSVKDIYLCAQLVTNPELYQKPPSMISIEFIDEEEIKRSKNSLLSSNLTAAIFRCFSLKTPYIVLKKYSNEDKEKKRYEKILHSSPNTIENKILPRQHGKSSNLIRVVRSDPEFIISSKKREIQRSRRSELIQLHALVSKLWTNFKEKPSLGESYLEVPNYLAAAERYLNDLESSFPQGIDSEDTLLKIDVVSNELDKIEEYLVNFSNHLRSILHEWKENTPIDHTMIFLRALLQNSAQRMSEMIDYPGVYQIMLVPAETIGLYDESYKSTKSLLWYFFDKNSGINTYRYFFPHSLFHRLGAIPLIAREVAALLMSPTLVSYFGYNLNERRQNLGNNGKITIKPQKIKGDSSYEEFIQDNVSRFGWDIQDFERLNSTLIELFNFAYKVYDQIYISSQSKHGFPGMCILSDPQDNDFYLRRASREIVKDWIASFIMGPAYYHCCARFSFGFSSPKSIFYDYYLYGDKPLETVPLSVRLNEIARVLILLGYKFIEDKPVIEMIDINKKLMSLLEALPIKKYCTEHHDEAILSVYPKLVKGEIVFEHPRIILNALWHAVSHRGYYVNELAMALSLLPKNR